MKLNFIDDKISFKKIIIKFIISLIILLFIDSIYFKLASNIHNTVFKLIKPRNIRILSALLSWSLLALTITLLNPNNLKECAIYGMFSGFLIYGVYNSTNYATIKNWTLDMCIFDTLWGTFLCSIVSRSESFSNSIV